MPNQSGEFKGPEILLWTPGLDSNTCTEKLLKTVKTVNVTVLYLVVNAEIVRLTCVDMDILCITLFTYVPLIKESNTLNLSMFFFGSLSILKVIIALHALAVFSQKLQLEHTRDRKKNARALCYSKLIIIMLF